MPLEGDRAELRVSYSGVRGIYGQSLTLAVAARFGEAFARLVSERFPAPTVIVGRDTRPSGNELLPAVIRGLTRLPCSLIDVGVVPSPTVQVAMAELGAQAAIIITASHNPAQWNGFKFLIGPHNIVLNADQTRQLFELSRQVADAFAPQATPPAAPAAPLAADCHPQALNLHLRRVLEQVDAAAIRRRRFRVVIDSCRGAGQDVTARLLQELGCGVVPVQAERDSEPIAANLGALAAAVLEQRCDIGFAQDLDADRLALVTEDGKAIGEECTLAFAVDHLLNRAGDVSPVVVKNSSTSRMIDDLCAAHGAELRVAKVGEVNLSQAMIELQEQGRAVFGGEGNGGVMYPPVCYGRDSLIGIALVLEYAAASGLPLSALAARLPQYHIIKRKLEGLAPERVPQALAAVRRLFEGQEMSDFDGLKVTWPDGAWVQVRPSNTEPIVRIIAESASPELSESLYHQVENEIAPLLRS
jgi:phosphomannomutase